MHDHDLQADESTSHPLTPACLPQLRYLDVCGSGSYATQVIRPFLPQLHAVELNPFEYALLSTAESLRLLLLPFGRHSRLEIFSALASLPPFVSIDDDKYWPIGDESLQEILDTLKDLLETAKTGLRVVLLSTQIINGEMEVMIQQLEDRGIRVVREGRKLSFSRSVEILEEILEEEKCAAAGIVELRE